MKIIITGGSGQIGRHLTQSLTSQGHEVVILSRSPHKVKDLPAGARAIKWDAKTSQGWLGEVETAEAIVNLAGSNLAGSGFFPARWTEARKKVHLESRLQVGQAVTDAVARADKKPEVVIQASAIGYYGPRGDEILSEYDTQPGDDFMASICIQWEDSTKAVEELGVRRAIIRSGIVLDPEEGALLRLLLPYKMFVGGPMGSGEQWYSWIHPDDETGAIEFLLENQTANGVYNLVAPNPEKNKDFGKTLGKVMGRPSLIPLPGFIMKMAFGEVMTVALDGQRLSPERLLEQGYQFKFPKLEPALRDLLQ